MSNSTAEESRPFLFDPEALGKSLREVAVDVIETSKQNVVSRWYHSDDGADVHIWNDQHGNIIKQQVCFCGQVVGWNILDGVKTGYVVEVEKKEEDKHPYDEKLKIQYDEVIQPTTLQQGMQVIQSMEAINSNERADILINFKDSPQMSKMKPEVFLQRFGQHRSQKVRFLQKLLLQFNKFFKKE